MDPMDVGGWTSPKQLASLDQIIRNTDLQEPIIEIGCHLGRSSIAIGRAASETGKLLICIDPWQDWYTGNVKKESNRVNGNETFSQYKQNMESSGLKLGEDYIFLRSPSLAAAELISTASVVFIDGDHSYDAVLHDIQAWMPKIPSGGVIAGDDYGHRRFPGVKQAWDEIFGNDKAVENDLVWTMID